VEMQQARELLSGSPVRVDVRLLVTHRKQTIPLFHFCYPGAKTTILWSHANAMDCGEMYFFFVQFAERLRVNVAAYDYSGYGAATGVPTERDIYADARASYEYLCSCNAGVPDWHLVLYGQSIGSVPTLWLATHYPVKGVILHAPLLSGLRFLIPPADGFCSPGGCCSPVCVYALCDPFPNIKRIKKVTSPVLLMHGTLDKTVDFSHTLKLHARCPAPFKREPYIIKGAGHENVVDSDPEMYFTQVREFVRSVRAAGSYPPLAPTTDSRAVAPASGSHLGAHGGHHGSLVGGHVGGGVGGAMLDYERICTSCSETPQSANPGRAVARTSPAVHSSPAVRSSPARCVHSNDWTLHSNDWTPADTSCVDVLEPPHTPSMARS